MLEPGLDQASGLRRFMEQRTERILPVAGCAEHPGYAVRIAQSLCDAGLRVTLVSDFDQELDFAAQCRSRKGFSAMHALQMGHAMRDLSALSSQADLTLVAVDDARLARGLTLGAHEAVVLTGADPQAIATAYARIKALVGLGPVREVRTLFDRCSAGEPAQQGHRRLAQAVTRFLGVDLSFGGAAPEPWAPGGYRPIAEALDDWSRFRTPRRSACLPH
jgi:hypothetical protein